MFNKYCYELPDNAEDVCKSVSKALKTGVILKIFQWLVISWKCLIIRVTIFRMKGRVC